MPAQLITDVTVAARALCDGKLVAFATETVYGLGANALDTFAVAKVFAAKERPYFDPLIVHLANVLQVEEIVREIPKNSRKLMDKFWPGPLTLVLPKQPHVPDLVTAGLPDVAVRIPDHPVALEMLKQANIPVAAPSANPFGRISPTTAQHVLQHLGDKIDYVLDGGPCRVGVESTVLHVHASGATLLRPGGITREEIEALIGPIQVEMGLSSTDAQPAPGMLSQHYAPQTPLRIVNTFCDVANGQGIGALSFLNLPDADRFEVVKVLSETGSLTEAAAHFFAMLRELDEANIHEIVAVRFPNEGLGVALNDRLTRAAQ